MLRIAFPQSQHLPHTHPGHRGHPRHPLRQALITRLLRVQDVKLSRRPHHLMLVASPLRLQPRHTAPARQHRPQKCPCSCSTSSPLQLGRGREARPHRRREYWSAEDLPLSDLLPFGFRAPFGWKFPEAVGVWLARYSSPDVWPVSPPDESWPVEYSPLPEDWTAARSRDGPPTWPSRL